MNPHNSAPQPIFGAAVPKGRGKDKIGLSGPKIIQGEKGGGEAAVKGTGAGHQHPVHSLL